jgi:hypothetical protein
VDYLSSALSTLLSRVGAPPLAAACVPAPAPPAAVAEPPLAPADDAALLEQQLQELQARLSRIKGEETAPVAAPVTPALQQRPAPPRAAPPPQPQLPGAAAAPRGGGAAAFAARGNSAATPPAPSPPHRAPAGAVPAMRRGVSFTEAHI